MIAKDCIDYDNCIYKNDNTCFYDNLADSYLYHMGEIPVPPCQFDVKVGDKVCLSLDSRWDRDYADKGKEYELIVCKIDWRRNVLWLNDCPHEIHFSLISRVNDKPIEVNI